MAHAFCIHLPTRTPARLLRFFSIAAAVTLGQDANDCLQTEDLLYGTESHRDTYSWVCCNNQRMAEHRGFQDSVDFWGQLEADPRATNGGEFTFYDAQCGIPLYIAPRGRSFEEWREESHHHGWPSFRDEERVLENLREVGHGELVSTCDTHLGHNIPDGRNRDCINLICMAGISNTTSVQREIDLSQSISSNEAGSHGSSGEVTPSSGGSGANLDGSTAEDGNAESVQGSAVTSGSSSDANGRLTYRPSFFVAGTLVHFSLHLRGS